MQQVTINVPDMQSTHCQTRVKNAVSEVEGVQIQEMEAGKLTVSVSSEDTKNEVVNAIEKAGYPVASAVMF
ncbi:MAG TPA: heavy-metal-associated domain-containing protein [Flavipsychrobacter sp.]|nr:heavy-metal-associated domain-containing protein [Flavipsychrobacter sp.]